MSLGWRGLFLVNVPLAVIRLLFANFGTSRKLITEAKDSSYLVP